MSGMHDEAGAGEARPLRGAPRSVWNVADWLAYAACVALATAAVLYAMNLRARVANLDARLEVAQMRLAAADRAMVDARRVGFETQSALAVLAAADLTRVDLQGAPAAPQASGRLLWSRESGMVFAADNLPPLPAGRIYQVWLVAGGPAVSAGLVAPDETGRGVGIFRTPIDVTGLVTVSVTIEPEGGVPAPTGAFYLTGKARASGY
jgi:hypothetical protein